MIGPMADPGLLARHLGTLGRVVLGYSGGVDSTVLAVVGSRTLGPEGFLAVTGISDSLPEAQRAAAMAIATEHGIPVRELGTAELQDPRYVANQPDRCYWCKTELWSRLTALARDEGFDTVIDGTHAGDLGDHRPGGRAAEEHGVRSPFLELGWTKEDVRATARSLDLPIWDAPAQPCLSSRIRYGLEVTPARLRQVERGERFLRSLGVQGNLRVRHLGLTARVEVDPAMRVMVEGQWDRVLRRFEQLGFETVELVGYRRGALLALAGEGIPG